MEGLVYPIVGATRLAVRRVKLHRNVRKLHKTMKLKRSQSFTMPAMSPTMTEGNITTWKVKEGQSYSAGDVLLDIETDKAQMDVEAQDDGIMARILQGDGSKGVKVGTRIAVYAEPGDDLENLDMPADESNSTALEATNSTLLEASPPKLSTISQNNPSVAPFMEPDMSSPTRADELSSHKEGEKPQKQRYPLYPSVVQLLRNNGLNLAEAEKIPSTGPNGRLLKGDVLAYLGAIESSYPQAQSKRLEKLSHLNLSNINRTVAAQPGVQSGSPPGEGDVSLPFAESISEFAVTVSLKTIRDVQQRIHSTLGIDIPLSTFIARAVEISNVDLPRRNTAPTADELFNEILGLNKISSDSTRGHFKPRILELPPTASVPSSVQSADPGIIDILAGTSRTRSAGLSSKLSSSVVGHRNSNILSLAVPKVDEKRAKIFLERVKTILQVDPGRLIL